MQAFFIIFFVVFVVGCSDVVSTRFATLDEARKAKAFERGWFPPILPDPSTDILERNNVDLNNGQGTFMYQLIERGDFTNRLAGLKATVVHEKDSDVFIISTNGSRWRIVLPKNLGEGHYSVMFKLK